MHVLDFGVCICVWNQLSQEETEVSFSVNIVTGDWTIGAVGDLSECRGGLFCDEPGLGKTITSIALVLKTLGMRARAPPRSDILPNGAYVTMEDAERIVSLRFEPVGLLSRRDIEESGNVREVTAPRHHRQPGGNSKRIPTPKFGAETMKTYQDDDVCQTLSYLTDSDGLGQFCNAKEEKNIATRLLRWEKLRYSAISDKDRPSRLLCIPLRFNPHRCPAYSA